MHRDSEHFIKHQWGLEFQSLGAVGVGSARVEWRQIDTDVAGGREEEKHW